MNYLPHEKCLQIAKNSDVLLLLVTSEENLPGKIFEYLALKKPIMAIAPEKSLASKLIKSLNAGIILPPKNLKKIKKAILDLYQKWKIGKLLKDVNYSSKLEEYDRKFLTMKLASIFEKVKK